MKGKASMKDIFIGVAGAGIITLTTAWYAFVGYLSHETNHMKSISQIRQDAQSFEADLGISHNFSKQVTGGFDFVRLKMQENEPVIIKCKEGFEGTELDCLKKVVEYYNKVFDTINENYSFHIVGSEEEVSDNCTIITVENGELSNEIAGCVADRKISAFPIDKGYFFTKAQIILNLDRIKELGLGESVIERTLMHEMGHVLGLGDVYNSVGEKTRGCIYGTTFMQYDTKINHLYPNDYAVLQTLYSNEYKKHDNYEDAVKVVNEKINNYKASFYKYCSDIINKRECDDLSPTRFKAIAGTGFGWSKINKKGEVRRKYYIHFNEDGTCLLSMYTKNGDLLETVGGTFLESNGVIFVEGINIENSNNYDPNDEEDLSHKMIFGIFGDLSGKYNILDGKTQSQSQYIVNKKTTSK